MNKEDLKNEMKKMQEMMNQVKNLTDVTRLRKQIDEMQKQIELNLIEK